MRLPPSWPHLDHFLAVSNRNRPPLGLVRLPAILSATAEFQGVQPVWLQLSRDRKSLKWRENVQVRGIETGPVARSRRHYSPSGAERGRSGDLS